MKLNRILAMFCAASLAAACVVVAPGCDSGSGEIPLAKVPPPPEGFNTPAKTKAPAGGSPTNVNSMRK